MFKDTKMRVMYDNEILYECSNNHLLYSHLIQNWKKYPIGAIITKNGKNFKYLEEDKVRVVRYAKFYGWK